MIAIIGAMAKEVESLIALLDEVVAKNFSNLICYEGKINNVKVVIAKAGIGKVNASITTTLICHHYHPRLVINLGVAGGYSTHLKPLDIVVGTKVGYHDVDVTIDSDLLYGQLPSLPRFFNSDEKAVDQLKDFKLQNRNILFGTILTGDQFISNLSQVEALIRKYYQDDNVLAVEMESAAIAQVANTFQIPFIVIRSISDIIGSNNQSNKYYDFVEEACLNATEVTKHLLRK